LKHQNGGILDALDLARQIVDVVEDRKAEHITLLDLRPETIIADFFVIANGNSDRQLRALKDYVREDIKARHGRIPFSMEGTPESGWIVLDYGDVIVHLFSEEIRDYYDIESLWSHAANVLLSIQ
jgi:ribosome-associated protein